MKLQEAISIILNEWNIQQKDEISKGIGSIKKVFPLKSNPDYIVKTFPIRFKSHIQKEEKFYKSHPNLYAKIFKVNYDKGWMIQEKLNTNIFLQKLDQITEILSAKFNYNTTGVEDKLHFFIEFVKFEKQDIDFFDFFENNEKKKFTLKLFQFIEKISKCDESVDLHQFNIGLDKNNNIKLLDI